ncbi:hypothetical protein MTsPCn9_29030 [Croceitalea sp. MTPC9]|uniref:hypothetical protein n=1 Tax=unclassified Croceitalea TaxID=2632280 RepID=UPI002B39912B|nr:hypothetical protein MTsPCn6_30520 [Croceitalea sp. MTPC6]GMN17963.1 hypothetical protein MTsPCn9_29030 [Croceitalea sp. MTPC9]
MNDAKDTLSQIIKLTSIMESDYPELYRFLDKNPITVPTMAHPNLDEKILQEYLNGLKELLKHHSAKHKK